MLLRSDKGAALKYKCHTADRLFINDLIITTWYASELGLQYCCLFNFYGQAVCQIDNRNMTNTLLLKDSAL